MKEYFLNRLLALAFLCVFVSSQALAQTSADEMKKNPACYAGNYLVYPSPGTDVVYSAVPDGFAPFYISHYGRHGSRNMLDASDAIEARDMLRQAKAKGKLLPLGDEVIKQLSTVIDQLDGRGGELTSIGRRQQEGIARRMFKAYPSVLSSSSSIRVRSSVVPRVILSMNAFCNELIRCDSSLRLDIDASHHDMFYICKGETAASHKGSDNQGRWQLRHQQFCDSLSHPQRLMGLLFKSPGFFDEKKSGKLSRDLFNVAVSLQNMPGISFSMLSLFSDQELWDYWQSQNAYWYGYAGLPTLKQLDRDYQESAALLRNILDEAQMALEQKSPSASLRFGHDTALLKLLALMNIANAQFRTSDLGSLPKSWADFKLVPMAANLQLVFFRNKKGDVLLKVLLNERETTLPFAAYRGCYYRWDDFQNFYEDLISHIPGVRSVY